MNPQTIRKRAIMRAIRTFSFYIVAEALIIIKNLIPQLQLDSITDGILVAVIGSLMAAWDKYKRDSLAL